LQLPQGPQTDQYKIYLSVNIKDNDNGVVAYNITNPVIVMSNDTSVKFFYESIKANITSNEVLMSLKSGDLNLVTSNAIALSFLINTAQINTTDNSSTNIDNIQKAVIKEFMAEKVTQLRFTDMKSVNLIETALLSITELPQQVTFYMAVKIFCSKFFLRGYRFNKYKILL
jgi:hypothetical protein